MEQTVCEDTKTDAPFIVFDVFILMIGLAIDGLRNDRWLGCDWVKVISARA